MLHGSTPEVVKRSPLTISHHLIHTYRVIVAEQRLRGVGGQRRNVNDDLLRRTLAWCAVCACACEMQI